MFQPLTPMIKIELRPSPFHGELYWIYTIQGEWVDQVWVSK